MSFLQPGFHPDHFTVGTVGEPGQRVFLLQAGLEDEIHTVKLEKGQVRVLSQELAAIIENSGRPGHLPEDLALREPTEPEWAAQGVICVYLEEEDRVMISMTEFVAELIEEPDGEASLVEAVLNNGHQLTFLATREQAAAVAIHGITLVESGRPPCPLCGYPLDPSGHACPRTNGNRAPQM